MRYVVPMSGPGAVGFEDGGWEARGALVLAHEGLRYAILRARRTGDTAAVRARPTHAPTMGFSEVVQIGMDRDEDAHVVKQPDGTTGSDVAVHFERAGVLYLSSLATDGYPEIDAEDGGTVSGLIKTLDDFATNFAAAPQAIVPARGPLATLQDLRDLRDVLTAVRDRLTPMLDAGKTADAAVAAHPTAQFDARWGHGPVTPDRFVRAAYAALAKERATPEQ